MPKRKPSRTHPKRATSRVVSAAAKKQKGVPKKPYEYDKIYPFGAGGIEEGYGVTTPDVDPADSTTWNARLLSQFNQTIDLWITDVEANAQLNGSTAQSRMYRQFFPRNVNQHTLTITGRMPNQYQYNRLASFVRQTQVNALTVGTAQRYAQKVGLESGVRTNKFNDAETTVTLYILGGGQNTNRSITKGEHKPWILEGHIKNIAAGGARFENAPGFTLEMVVVATPLSPIFDESQARGSRIASWMENLNAQGTNPFDYYRAADFLHKPGTPVPSRDDIQKLGGAIDAFKDLGAKLFGL